MEDYFRSKQAKRTAEWAAHITPIMEQGLWRHVIENERINQSSHNDFFGGSLSEPSSLSLLLLFTCGGRELTFNFAWCTCVCEPTRRKRPHDWALPLRTHGLGFAWNRGWDAFGMWSMRINASSSVRLSMNVRACSQPGQPGRTKRQE